MPRTDAIRVARILWVAWTVDDYGTHGPIRYGLTEQNARLRAAGYFDA
jgi:hypothetical protein